MPTLIAKQVPNGTLKGYWVRLGLYQVILVFEVNEKESIVSIDGIKHKRENVYWKRK
ncbi:type II toxin-antitoxin system RelE family toxin [Virgibacillus ainsalahensis]